MRQPFPQGGKGTLHYELEGVSEEQVHRYREAIDIILSQGVLNIHDGKAILDFNFEGRLSGVRFEFTKWKKKKNDNPPLSTAP